MLMDWPRPVRRFRSSVVASGSKTLDVSISNIRVPLLATVRGSVAHGVSRTGRMSHIAHNSITIYYSTPNKGANSIL
ncbi:hypothetical protein AGR1C_pAt40432 [Agrobacterium fabacearum TT111]|nr:hypothetical protein AGR1C_pAt40432 [Agrobacterium fabacearum TT111]